MQLLYVANIIGENNMINYLEEVPTASLDMFKGYYNTLFNMLYVYVYGGCNLTIGLARFHF